MNNKKISISITRCFHQQYGSRKGRLGLFDKTITVKSMVAVKLTFARSIPRQLKLFEPKRASENSKMTAPASGQLSTTSCDSVRSLKPRLWSSFGAKLDCNSKTSWYQVGTCKVAGREVCARVCTMNKYFDLIMRINTLLIGNVCINSYMYLMLVQCCWTRT